MNESRIPSFDQIIATLEKILDSPEFRATERRSRFLQYVVNEKLAGRADQIKGYTIGIDVFEKKPDFDPQADPVVRLEASRLRRDLEHYYLTDGARDEIRMSLPKGSYVPSIEFVSDQSPRTALDTGNGTDRENAPAGEDPATISHGPDQKPAGALRRTRRIGRLDVHTAIASITVAAVLVAVAWFVLRSGPEVGQPSDTVHGLTVYVQPFEAVGPGAAPLARGITTEMVSVLSRFVELQVYPVSADFTGPKPDLTNSAIRGYSLSGSVQIVGEELRVTARLQDAGDGLQVWTERYDATYSPQDVFDIQDHIAIEVARKLAEPFGLLRKLSREQLVNRHDPSLAAYKCVLLGYAYRQKFSEDLHRLARNCLEQAVRTDPQYARAWALLAHVYADEYRAFFNTLPNARTRSIDAARKAVELNPDDVLSYQALSLAYFVNGDINASLKAASRAVEKNPHNMEALLQFGMRTAFSGDWEKGFETMTRAIRESPAAPFWYHFFPSLYHYTKADYDSARIAIEKVRVSDLTLVAAVRAMIYGQLEMQEEAERALAIARRLDPLFDKRARDWFAVHHIGNEILDHIMEGLFKAGLPRSKA